MENAHSKSREKILSCLQEWIDSRGCPPTLRELAEAAGFKSTCTVRYHLKKLRDAGLVRLKQGISRGIMPVKRPMEIPILGRISAGAPIDAIENIEGYIAFSDMFREIGNIFALRVKGDSMVNAGILDNDIVFIRKQQTAQNGEIVAALLGDEAVVKRLELKAKSVRLISENPRYKPIVSNDIKILGKVIFVLRNYNT
ncbi:MAG: transcriptional repressor LexA [Planctomycetes bacterium]|nr:transcriptional repressor LexA [Planctomycetota bacterium]